jgi:putative colanic acid biosynthesis acetyltransferase WcaF
MRLDRFRPVPGVAGRGIAVEIAWWFSQILFGSAFLPGSSWRRTLLRWFGARIGAGVVIKPAVKIKYPWKLSVGDWTWIGERVWIDNLDQVSIGAHCCISQEAYLCTGNHDWSDETFSLRMAPIEIQDRCWIGARSVVAPGCVAKEGSVLSMASLGHGTLEPWSIYVGVPAQRSAERKRRWPQNPVS